MPSPITTVCLAIVLVSVGIGRAIGITIPPVWAPFDRVFAMIIGFQAIVAYCSSYMARPITSQPKRREGDVDGILDAELFKDEVLQNQLLICSTVTLTSVVLILGHTCCKDGKWTGAADGDDAAMIITGMLGEFIWFIASIAFFTGDHHTQEKRKKELNGMLVAHYPGWVVEDDGKSSKEKKGKKDE